jgi:hypothetical protein
MNPSLSEDDPRRQLKPLMLVYVDAPEGRMWLASRLHQAMLNIVSIETTGQPLIVPRANP